MRALTSAAIAVSLLVPSVGRAEPAGDAIVMTASGGFQPGLGIYPPASQTMWLTGTMTYVGSTGVLVTAVCSFAGVGVADSVAEGLGTFSGSCGDRTFTSCVHVRAGVNIDVTCFQTDPANEMRLHLVMQAVDSIPTTQVTYTGGGAFVGV